MGMGKTEKEYRMDKLNEKKHTVTITEPYFIIHIYGTKTPIQTFTFFIFFYL